MRLAEFIPQNMATIVARWEAFAATRLPAAGNMDSLALRDHVEPILRAIVLDLGTPQTLEQQSAKSMGMAPEPFPARETAAHVHAVLRAKAGFDIKQMASEYRALRASVLSLWIEAQSPVEVDLEDMIRFNEAIDQALAESISHFSDEVEQARNLLLGMLSHDMRSPLQTIQLTAKYLGRLHAGDAVSDAARRLVNSGSRMQALLDDLIDFNRTNLGIGIAIRADTVDLGELCAEEIDEIRAARPGSRIDLAVQGDCKGQWDGMRIRQVLCNLMVNAVSYGTPGEPVTVKVTGSADEVEIEVGNKGHVIPANVLTQIFNPLTRGLQKDDDTGRGLGLYIVSEIAKAHGGHVEALSDETGTRFAVHLPRNASA